MDFTEREGILSDYYKELYETKNSISFFATMMRDLLTIGIESKEYQLIGKLVKLYGRKSVFHAIVDIAESNDLDISKFPYGLLAYICKRNTGIIDEKNYSSYPSLIGFIERVDKELEKARR